MTTPKWPTTTYPFYAYPLQQAEDPGKIASRFDSGHVVMRNRYTRPRRRWLFEAPVTEEADLNLVMGFWRDRGNGADAWYWDNVANDLWDPYDAPTLSQTAGGALGSRTYYVEYAWYTTAGLHTRTSAMEGSQAVDASKYLTVTVPAFPKGVDKAYIYIGTSTGVLYYSGLISTTAGTWTEDSASTTVNGDSASGQKVLNVTATTNFQVGGVVIINSGGDRQETKIIASISAGVSLTMSENLTYTHTLAQGDAVATVIGNSAQATPPTTNDLVEEIKVRFATDPEISRVNQAVWSLSFEVIEDLSS